MYTIRYRTFGQWYTHPQTFPTWSKAEREVIWLDSQGYLESVEIIQV